MDLLFWNSIQVRTSKIAGNSEMLQVVWLFDGFKFRHSQILYSGGVSDFFNFFSWYKVILLSQYSTYDVFLVNTSVIKSGGRITQPTWG